MISFLQAFFPTLAAWLISLIGRKAVVFLAAVAAFTAATAIFLSVITSAVTQILASSVLPSWVDYGVGLFLPFSFFTDLSLLVGAYAARWAYDIILTKIELINAAT